MKRMNMKGGIYYIENLLALDAFDINPDHPSHKDIIFNNRQRTDYIWIEQQINYLNQLSDRKRHIVRAYTIYGDKFINNFLRGTLTPAIIEITLAKIERDHENPFMYQHQDKTGKTELDQEYKENIIEYTGQFIEEFKEIIESSPRLTKKMVMFRGLNSDQFLKDAMIINNQGNKSVNYTEFISTSFYLPASIVFMLGACCMLELHVDISVPCLLTGHFSRRRGEFEITFIPNTKMTSIQSVLKIPVEDYDEEDVLLHPEKIGVPAIHVYEAAILY